MGGEAAGLGPGTTFGRDFRVVRALRAGGMGAVYVVDQLSTGKQRALKVMAPELASDPDVRERFVQEARAASRIDSDHVVEIVTAGVDEATGAPFLVMELLRGEELTDALHRTGPLPLGDAAEVFSQIGHALEQAHAQGIVHRDLKPENVFLAAARRRDTAFTAKVLDFGIAKLVDDSRQKTGTRPLGTPLFMAPEQTDRKGRICPATDVWALGLIMFRLLTGVDFWREADGSLPMLLREICVDEIPPARVRAGELGVAHLLPPGFDSWFARCVVRDIDARFPEAGACVRAFAELVGHDAPRGRLVMQAPAAGGATGSMFPPAAGLPTVAGVAAGPAGLPGSASIRIDPTGGATPSDPTMANAATAFVTGSPTALTQSDAAPSTPAAAASGSKTRIAAVAGVGVLAAAVGGYFAFREPAASSPSAMLPSASVSAHAAAAGPAPSGSVMPASAAGGAASAAAGGGTCPDGMVLLLGGKMFMGARDLTDDAKPPHEVTVSTFCFDRTEVTTKAYGECREKGECEPPLDHVSWPKISDKAKKLYSPLCNASKADRADHPINCVAWAMADNYCKKRGARLPTEAEWEYAARGTSSRKYPWGDDPVGPTRLNACGKECASWGTANGDPRQTMHAEDDGFAATAPVGSFPAGASSHGVLDLAGNVWEWTADWYAPYPADPQTDPKGPESGTQRVARGGDFFGSNPDWARPAYRWKTDPETYNHAIGFRCAASPR